MRKTFSTLTLINTFVAALIATTAASAQTVSLSAGDKYAGLGSSFAAGPGIDNQLGG